MGMKENWALFIKMCKSKGKSHNKAAQYWDGIGTVLSLSLIFLGALTTFMALIKAIPVTLVAGVACVATLISAISAFLRPADRRQMQSAASREFQELMMKMVRCEGEQEYEELWRDLNKAIVDAPFLPKKFVEHIDIEWTMTPELSRLIEEKEGSGESSSGDGTEEKEGDSKEISGIDNYGYGTINRTHSQPNILRESEKENEQLELLVQK